LGLIETLFTRGVMTMGPSKHDPDRRVGTFNREFVATLPAFRAAEMGRFEWIVGEWSYENLVPMTPANPAYVDVGVATFTLSENGAWICGGPRDGPQQRQITFDPFSAQWI
jgi:hypothetical protein